MNNEATLPQLLIMKILPLATRLITIRTMVQVWVFGVLSSEVLISFGPFISSRIFWEERDNPLLNSQIWLDRQFNFCVCSFWRFDILYVGPVANS